ncbi:MAG TPA: glucosamine-6-phosphate deaminase [Pyrinomonadaceae bacterium]
MESSAASSINNQGLVEKFRADNLNVYIYESRPALGKAAASAVAAEIQNQIEKQARAVGIFASAPSQNEFLSELVSSMNVDWSRLTAFHLDEYLGMDDRAPQSFRRFLLDRLVDKVPLGQFHGLRGEADDAVGECRRYARLLTENPPHFAVLGIGENGHLAFIDPPFCNFKDPEAVKIVELDEVCREQQVHDGAFGNIDDVPRQALSLTIPTIMVRRKLFAIVPGSAKRQAIKDTLEGPIATACPASILRTHQDAHLFIDLDSAALLGR